MISLLILKKQHKNIFEILDEISYYTETENKLKQNTSEVIINIDLLNKKFFSHLEMEDIFLYPEFIKVTKNTNIATLNIEDSFKLSTQILNFKNTYNNTENLLKKPKKFKEDFNNILNQIKTKFLNEETNIYSLIKEN